MPTHRPAHWKPRHRRSHRTVTILSVLLALAGAAAIGVIVRATGGGGVRLPIDIGAGPDRDERAASRNFNRLTAPAPASVAASGWAAAGQSPSPSPTRPTTRRSTAAGKRVLAATPVPRVGVGCSGYTGNQLIACNLLPSFGFDTGQMPPLVNLWNGESNWNVHATNPDSGAYGIPQALPPDKMATVAPDWRTSAATQIRWGLGYIKARYGTPANAWSTWLSRSPHWY